MAYIIAIDEGTTSTRAVLYDLDKKRITAQKASPVKQIYPEQGYVEENAGEIYAETLASLVEMIEQADKPESILGIGVTNQRETVIAWDKITGKPLYNAIVWQCRRTAETIAEIGEKHGGTIREKTGLVLDAYFSASKMKWLMDNVPAIREKSRRGRAVLRNGRQFSLLQTHGRESICNRRYQRVPNDAFQYSHLRMGRRASEYFRNSEKLSAESYHVGRDGWGIRV